MADFPIVIQPKSARNRLLFHTSSARPLTAERDLLNISLSNVACTWRLSAIRLPKPMPPAVDGAIYLGPFDSHPRYGALLLSHIHHVFKATCSSSAQSLAWIIAYSFISSGVTDLRKCRSPRPVISRVAGMTRQWLQLCHIYGRSGSTPRWWVVLIF